MYETLSNYLKIPRCALDDGNQQKTNQPKSRNKQTNKKQRQQKRSILQTPNTIFYLLKRKKQPKSSFKKRYDC